MSGSTDETRATLRYAARNEHENEQKARPSSTATRGVRRAIEHDAEPGGAERAHWKFLPLVFALGFLARATVALNTDAAPHPDSIFQYLEQGHRLAFGNGIIPWEYVYGIRSWIIPGFIALILESLSAAGLNSPLIYQPVVKLVFCAISLSLPLSVYRITQSLLDENSARFALLATSFWYEIVYYAHTPMPDALAAYAIFGALMFLLRPPTMRTMVAFGALTGLALVLRYQLAAPVIVMCGIAAGRWRWNGWPALAACFVVLMLSGALDAYTWGAWFASILNNFELNFFRDVGAQFSRRREYYYLATLAITSLGFAYAGGLGLLLHWRRAWPLLAVGSAALVVFSIVGHKEHRFIFVLVPIYLIGIAALLCKIDVAARSSAAARIIVFAATSLALVPMALTGLGIGHSLHRDDHVMRVYLKRDDLMRAYLMLSRRPRVEGVIDQSTTEWYDSGGYYYLHKDVPLYRWDMPGTHVAAVLKSPARFATHWITETDRPPSPAYSLLDRIGTIRVWERNGGLLKTEIAPGYSRRAPAPFAGFERIVSASAITPRGKLEPTKSSATPSALR